LNYSPMGLGAEFAPSAAIQKPHDMGQFDQFDKSAGQ